MTFRVDKEREFMNIVLENYCKIEDIFINFFISYIPEHNDNVKRT